MLELIIYNAFFTFHHDILASRHGEIALLSRIEYEYSDFTPFYQLILNY